MNKPKYFLVVLLASIFLFESISPFFFHDYSSFSSSRSWSKKGHPGTRRRRRRRRRRCSGGGNVVFGSGNPFAGWNSGGSSARPPIINAPMNINSFDGVFNNSTVAGQAGGRGNTSMAKQMNMKKYF